MAELTTLAESLECFAFALAQGLELITHGGGGGPHHWHFCVKGIMLNNYLEYPPTPHSPTPVPDLKLLFLPEQYNSEHP